MEGSYKKAFLLSLILHFIVGVLFISEFSTPLTEKKIKHLQPHTQSGPIIHAVSMDWKEVEKQISKIKQEKNAKQKREIAKKRALEEKARLAKLEAKSAQEKIDKMKQEADKLKKSQELVEMKAKEDLARIKIETERALKDAEALKQLNAAEKKRLEKTKQEQAALEAKKKADEERALKKKHDLAYQNRIENVESQQLLHYQALIVEEIGHHWLVPRNIEKNLACKLQIKLMENGDVISVVVIKSSGNALLDRSAKLAVYKASPLPVPNDPDLFEKFRVLNLTVRPESVVSSA